jgi:hypothetical protein
MSMREYYGQEEVLAATATIVMRVRIAKRVPRRPCNLGHGVGREIKRKAVTKNVRRKTPDHIMLQSELGASEKKNRERMSEPSIVDSTSSPVTMLFATGDKEAAILTKNLRDESEDGDEEKGKRNKIGGETDPGCSATKE